MYVKTFPTTKNAVNNLEEVLVDFTKTSDGYCETYVSEITNFNN
jgi:hypothetical protein